MVCSWQRFGRRGVVWCRISHFECSIQTRRASGNGYSVTGRAVDFERGFLRLHDSKTGQKAIILNGPAVAVLANLPRLGAYVIAGQSAGSDNEKPRADLAAMEGAC
jgi:hypothetical protein